jgi:hypothetical protein
MCALECHTVFVRDTPGQLTSDLLPSQTSGGDEVPRVNKKDNGAYTLIGELNSECRKDGYEMCTGGSKHHGSSVIAGKKKITRNCRNLLHMKHTSAASTWPMKPYQWRQPSTKYPSKLGTCPKGLSVRSASFSAMQIKQTLLGRSRCDAGSQHRGGVGGGGRPGGACGLQEGEA